jgi:membrane dipeptidase
MFNRRQAILMTVAGSLGSWNRIATAASRTFSDEQYTATMVIDLLSTPGGSDVSAPDDAPLSPKDIADVRASGVTAVNLTVGEPGNGPGRFEKSIALIAGYEHELNAHPEVFLKVLSARDLTLAKSTGRTGLIFGAEDSSMFDGDLKRVAMFYDLGLRICQLTYNRQNLMGSGCLEPSDGGLSKLGRELVAEMNRLHMLIDASHAGPRTMSETIAASHAPVAISHTGCRALADLPRNTSDRELKAVADRGGVVGIYFMPFLRVSGQPHADDVIRHLEHAVNICGEDHVGLGTDGAISGIALNDAYRKMIRAFVEDRVRAGIAAPGESPDVFNLIPEYNDCRRLKTLADDLANRGWTSGRIEKVLGQNFARLFGEVWT